MNEYNKEDIKNLHYNNLNEIQYEYGGQIYHCRMEHLKEILVTCWNLQQENKKYKEVINRAIEYIKEKARNNCWIDQYESCDLIKILKEVE